MPFIRLCDNYNDHPKFECLSDGAFRLWHQGMGFCRKYQTDGYIPMTTVRGFKAYTQKRLQELLAPWQTGANALWILHDVGVKVHDYLQWNPSKDEENERRSEAKERMRQIRERRQTTGIPPSRSHSVRANNSRTFASSSQEVLDRIGSSSNSKKEKDRKDPPLGEKDLNWRAGRLLERYAELFEKHRHGAKLRLLRNALEFSDAYQLCETWDDLRLEKLAQIVLTTDDPFIAGTDRGFKIFALKASWADLRLSEIERKTGVSA